MELQGDGHPLIFADAAVVVGLQIGQLVGLVEWVLLQVQPGGVDVGRADVGPLRQGPLADNGKCNCFTPVHPVDLVPRLQLAAPDIGLKPRLFRQGHRPVHTLPLGLARVQELLVAGAVGLHSFQIAGNQPVVAVFFVVEQCLAQLLPSGLFLLFFAHGMFLLLCRGRRPRRPGYSGQRAGLYTLS